MWERDVFLEGHIQPLSQGAEPQHLQKIFGSYIYAKMYDAQATKFCMVIKL